MIHQPLGTTGLVLPRVIFGTSTLGNLFQAVPKETKLAIIKEVFNHIEPPVVFDSAGKYGAGLALEVIGWALRELDIAPEDVIISNKLAWVRTPLTTPEPTFEPGAWVGLEHDAVQDISRAGILRCWEQGNELLGGVYPSQMVSVHDPDEYLAGADSEAERGKRFDDILAAYDALNELKQQGLVKAVGVGAKDWRTIQEIDRAVPLDWVMFANSYTLYSHPAALLSFMDELQAKQVAIINSAVFNAGFLTGGAFFDYRKLDPNDAADQKIFLWRERFFALCEAYQISPADACIQFGMSHPGIVSIALSTSKPERVQQNIASVEANIPAEFWDALQDAGLIASDFRYLVS
ncbi:MAG: L-fucose dehydrogenase [Anaerolineaceae bacterium]|nr:L-fucose dehydrogenase [Anaerolineaceae bacterium]